MSEHHVCFCGPCSTKVAVMEADIARKDRTIFALNEEYRELRDSSGQWAEIAGVMQAERDKAMQIIINLQDYLRANGRSFPAAVELICKWRAETGLREEAGLKRL